MKAQIAFYNSLPTHLQNFYTRGELAVLSATLNAEARGEGTLGLFAVGCVIRNRVYNPCWWGDDYREVCLLKHQFSCWWSDFSTCERALLGAALGGEPAVTDVAARVLAGEPDITAGANHYFNPHKVLPDWASRLVRVCRVGNHDFYRDV